MGNFVDPSELEQVVAALPPADASTAELNVLQDLKLGPSRDVGAGLLRKMQEFEAETISIYQQNAAKLDNAFKTIVGWADSYRSLHELAGRLLRGRRG